MEYLRSGSAVCPTNQVKADVYCLGMLLLMLCNLLYYNPCYDYRAREIRQDQLASLLNKTSQHYSANLCSLIGYALHPQILKRPTFISLQDALQPYYAAIDSGSPFYNNQVIIWCDDYPDL